MASWTEPDPNRIPTRTLDQNDFLELVAAQLTNQDPLNPMQDTQFIAQMAQFSALEQSKNMQQDMANLHANAVLGRVVEIQDDQGELVRGTVTAIQVDAGTPKIIVNGKPYALSTLLSVEPASTS
jgi:flagellar basal-body rod modification protein FlgD